MDASLNLDDLPPISDDELDYENESDQEESGAVHKNIYDDLSDVEKNNDDQLLDDVEMATATSGIGHSVTSLEVIQSSQGSEGHSSSSSRKRQAIRPPDDDAILLDDDVEVEEHETPTGQHATLPGGSDGEVSDGNNLPSGVGASNLAKEGRVKRVARRRISREQFGLKRTSAPKQVRVRDLQALFHSYNIDPDDDKLRFNCVFVTGAGGMTTYEISKIFAEYKPSVVRFIDESNCIVRFEENNDNFAMLIEMTKPLRRIRTPRKPEEGELLSDDEEEEGQVKEENGEDVAVVASKNKEKIVRGDVVEVDIEKVKVPAGKWRVVTRHVPEKRLILLRIATGFDVRRSIMFNPSFATDGKKIIDKADSEYVWFSDRDGIVRPGLNVFDEKGNELDWDYEHDTRFFDETVTTSPQKRAETATSTAKPQTEEANIAGLKIRSRGRGSKKFFQALSSDEDGGEEGTTREAATSGNTIKVGTLASDNVEK